MILIDVDGRAHELAEAGGYVGAMDLSDATGWTLKPDGRCRGEVCRPLLGGNITDQDGRISLAGSVDLLGLILVHDTLEGVAVVVPSAAEHAADNDGRAPLLELTDNDGQPVSFDALSGRKRVLVTWASWCGCRHELSSWQKLQDELGPKGRGRPDREATFDRPGRRPVQGLQIDAEQHHAALLRRGAPAAGPRPGTVGLDDPARRNPARGRRPVPRRGVPVVLAGLGRGGPARLRRDLTGSLGSGHGACEALS